MTDPRITIGAIRIAEWQPEDGEAYRAAVVGDCVLTDPEDKDLPDDELIAEAAYEAVYADIMRRDELSRTDVGIRLKVATLLYQRGHLTAGQAAEIVEMPRLRFLDELGRRGYAVITLDPEQVEDELREQVDVVVQLTAQRPAHGDLPRGERIAAVRKDFEGRAARVEEAVLRAGGEVLDRAWINQTLHVRLPATAIDAVAALEEVSLIDAPRSLKPED